MVRLSSRIRLLLALAVLAAGQAVGGAVVSGRLFVDLNGNGTFEPRERPLAGVLVSAWATTAVTDAEGLYRLELAPGTHLVHPSWPDGVWPATMPFWREVELADGEAKTVDFPFRASADRLPFYVVQLTDTHLGPSNVPRMEKVCELINGLDPQPAFVINTGDLGSAGTARSDEEAERGWKDVYLRAVAKLRAPLFHAVGSHDYGGIDAGAWEGAGRRYVGRGGYRHFCGPLNYAFSYSGWHFIVIEGATPSLPPDKHIQLTVPKETTAWLKAYLATVSQWEPKILFSHYDPNEVAGNSEELANLLKGKDLRRIYVGHDHEVRSFEFAYTPGRVTGALCGTWWAGNNPSGDAQGLRIVQLDERRLVHSAYVCPWRDHHIQLVAPDPLLPLKGKVEVAATIFDPKDTVFSVTADIGTRSRPATVTRRGPWKEVTGSIDTAELADGAYDLWIVVQRLDAEPTARYVPITVANAPAGPFVPAGKAELRLHARKNEAEAAVLVNGRKVGTIPAGAQAPTELVFDVPEDALAQIEVADDKGQTVRKPSPEPIATVSFVPGQVGAGEDARPDVFEVADILMRYDGARHYDILTAGYQFVEVRDLWYMRPKRYEARIRLAGHDRFRPDTSPAKEFEGGVYLRLRPERGLGPMGLVATRYGTVSCVPAALDVVLYEADRAIVRVQTEEAQGAFTWHFVHGPWGIVPPKYYAVLTLLSGDQTISLKTSPPPR